MLGKFGNNWILTEGLAYLNPTEIVPLDPTVIFIIFKSDM